MIVTDRRRWERRSYDYVAPDPAWPPRVPLWHLIEAEDFASRFARTAWIEDVKRRLGIIEAGDPAGTGSCQVEWPQIDERYRYSTYFWGAIPG